MKMRIYELTVYPGLDEHVNTALDIVSGRRLLTTMESDKWLKIFCAAKSSFPEVLDSLGGVFCMRDITDQLVSDRTQHFL